MHRLALDVDVEGRSHQIDEFRTVSPEPHPRQDRWRVSLGDNRYALRTGHLRRLTLDVDVERWMHHADGEVF